MTFHSIHLEFTAQKPLDRENCYAPPRYRSMMNDPGMNQEGLQKASLEFVKQLENEGISAQFYEDFSLRLQINEILAKIPPARNQAAA